MEIGIKLDTKEITDITVESIIKILREVRDCEFDSRVAFKALDMLNRSASQPITISNVSIVGDTIVSKIEEELKNESL